MLWKEPLQHLSSIPVLKVPSTAGEDEWKHTLCRLFKGVIPGKFILDFSSFDQCLISSRAYDLTFLWHMKVCICIVLNFKSVVLSVISLPFRMVPLRDWFSRCKSQHQSNDLGAVTRKTATEKAATIAQLNPSIPFIWKMILFTPGQ